MNKIALIFIALIFFAACDSKKSADGELTSDEGTTAPAEKPALNKLTDAESADGWKLLFDGSTTNGWRTFQNKECNSWEVVDGTLHAKPEEAADKRADLITVDQYANFDLVFEWMVPPGENSGVIYRSTEEFNRPYLSGPEYQVIDDKGYTSPLTETQTTASNYDMHAAPANKKINPAGEWNSGRIVANGNHVEHWLNGEKVLEYEINSEDWKNRKEASKWKDAKGYGIAPQGHIVLQDHGEEVSFRNIKIKTL